MAGRATYTEADKAKVFVVLTTNEGNIKRTSRETGVPAAVIHNYLGLPEIVAARSAIESGSIGRPDLAILNYLGVEDRHQSRGVKNRRRTSLSHRGAGE